MGGNVPEPELRRSTPPTAPCPRRLWIAWQNMEKDKALERRFQQVFVKQPNVEDTVRARKIATLDEDLCRGDFHPWYLDNP